MHGFQGEPVEQLTKEVVIAGSSTPSVEGSQDNSTDQQSCDTEEVAAALIQLNIATPSQPRVHRAAAARARAQPRPAAEPTRRSQRQRSKAPQAAASEGVPAVADGPAAAAEQVQLPGSCRAEVAAPPRTRGRKRSRSASASAAATPCRSCRTRVASPEKESTPCQQPTAASAGRAASAAACTRAKPGTGNRRGGGKKRSGGRKSARRPAKAAASAPAEVPAPEQPPALQPAVQSADTNTAPEAPAAAQAPRIRFKIPEGSSLLLENKPPSPTLMRKDSEPPLAPAADICAAGKHGLVIECFRTTHQYLYESGRNDAIHHSALFCVPSISRPSLTGVMNAFAKRVCKLLYPCKFSSDVQAAPVHGCRRLRRSTMRQRQPRQNPDASAAAQRWLPLRDSRPLLGGFCGGGCSSQCSTI